MHLPAPLAVLIVLAAACARGTPDPTPAPVRPDTRVAVASGLFEFHSAFWVNLHHFLYVLARARAGRDADRAAVAGALGDTAGLAARPAAERAALDAALAHYAAEIARRDLTFDTAMISAKNALADRGSAPSLGGANADPRLDARLVAALEGAAPAYRAVWWPRHDAANRAAAAGLLPLLARHGRPLASALARALDQPWAAAPVRVDLAPYTNWAGAYTTERPSHIMFSSTARGYRGTLGLEMLFHEVSHTMEDSLAAARARLAAEGKPAPYEVVHAIIFYNAGELARREVPGHVPYAEAEGLWERGRLGRYRAAIERHWRPHLDGRTSVREAMRAIVAEP